MDRTQYTAIRGCQLLYIWETTRCLDQASSNDWSLGGQVVIPLVLVMSFQHVSTQLKALSGQSNAATEDIVLGQNGTLLSCPKIDKWYLLT